MKSARTITVVSSHAEGEVGRVITGGVLPPPGDTLYDQSMHLWRNDDGLRKFLIYEPRGLFHRWQISKAAFRIWPFPHM